MKFELILALTLLAFGMLALPIAVYWVGQLVIGGYESEGGVAGLIGAIWDDLGRGSPAAWILVLSPYVVIQLFRVAFKLLRRS
ncbi:MAG TPA: hypothetical protein VF339_08175 [Gammaproteobacteria bacterium]